MAAPSADPAPPRLNDHVKHTTDTTQKIMKVINMATTCLMNPSAIVDVILQATGVLDKLGGVADKITGEMYSQAMKWLSDHKMGWVVGLLSGIFAGGGMGDAWTGSRHG
mmetsp:Transcript_5871/g.13042  ORF Transcript_5871/g.13042 Transcript_5871/m.13042 type:complete len:109 (+) Transcript_5871:347-673(+)